MLYAAVLASWHHTRKSLFKSTDKGATWVELNHNGVGYNIGEASDILVNPLDVNELWISHKGTYSDTRVYHSIDGGLNWTKISSVSTGYPGSPDGGSYPAYTLAYDEIREILYVGTDVGVFYYAKNENAWHNFSQCLPLAPVIDLEISRSNRTLKLGTYGRGVWESTLAFCPSEDILYVNSTTATDGDEFGAKTLVEFNHAIVPNGTHITAHSGSVIMFKEGVELNYGSDVCASILPTSCGNCAPTSQPVILANNQHNVDESTLESEMIQVSIFPNPAEDYLTIDMSTIVSKKMYIHDHTGKLIRAKSYNGKSLDKLDISTLEEGTYVISIVSESDKTYSSKFVKK